MKRNLILLFLSLIMIVCLVACGNEKPNDTEEEIKETSVEEQEDASVNEELKNYLNNYFNNATPCSLGNYVDADVVSIRLDEAYFTDKIEPDNTDGPYWSFGDIDGEKYLVIIGEIKNNSDQEIKSDLAFDLPRGLQNKTFVSVLNYNDQMILCQTAYTAYGSSDITDTLKAHETGKLIILCSLKDEEISNTSVSLLLGFSDLQEVIYNGYDGLDMDKCTHLLKYEVNDIKSR